MSQSQELRTKYLEFFASKGHEIVPSSSLIPENDPTTLFTGSGMQPMVPYLLGEKHPLGKRICDSQKSFRAGDIDDIGDNRHTTFFEMLGNWSLGDYFKEEQIEWIFEFYVKHLGLDPSRIYISVYRGNEKFGIPRDDEAVQLWKEQFASVGIEADAVDMAEKHGMQGGRIFYYPESENWWSRAGVPEKMPVGEPGGPDSEMFWDFGAELGLHETSKWKDKPCHPACDCGRFLEFGNNVFMQYKKTEDGFEELANKNIDFGGGLERIVVALNNDPDIFLGDLFTPIRDRIEAFSGKVYGVDEKETKAFRVVMDHLRAATFLIADGATPSNKDQGYFTRRLLRRAVRFARDLGIEKGLSREVASVVIDEYKGHYTNLAAKREMILSEIDAEESQFITTLERGLKEFDKKFNMTIQWGPFGNLEDPGYKDKLSKWENSEKKERTSVFSGQDAFTLYDTYGFPFEMTKELLQERSESTGIVFDLDKIEVGFQKSFEAHQEKSRSGSEQKFKGGLADASEATTALHSSTHLMLAGLRKVLGNHVHQAGSNITAERLRFDFTHPEKMTSEELQQVEDYVNEAIQSGLTVTMDEVAKTTAESDPTIEGSFWEKYPDIVKVYSMVGANGVTYSRELCGGPHVLDSKNMGRFKIKKEESSSRGVRRIKAVLIKD